MSGANRRNFFRRAPLLFCFTSTISRFGDRFFDGQYIFDTFLCLLYYTRCPHAQLFAPVPYGVGTTSRGTV